MHMLKGANCPPKQIAVSDETGCEVYSVGVVEWFSFHIYTTKRA